MAEDQHLYARMIGDKPSTTGQTCLPGMTGQDRQAPLSVEISRDAQYARVVHHPSQSLLHETECHQPLKLGPTTLNQSKSHRGPKKSFSSPSQGPKRSDMSYIVEALQLLTERSNTSSSVQSSLLATQQTMKLTLSKVLNDVATICKHLNVVGTQGASSMAGGVEDPDRSDSPWMTRTTNSLLARLLLIPF
ncbi:hypothetical protein CJ030_MR2G016446 [Morella rubra]|uniref:Uncharacterized protein n=1 Tax=Morella rubra TaxID=262757 RepID=A0A6A1WD19_9ROSI|nr:hypothetical protein CJ030_MR2G016446 [Morella rubra]